MGRVRPQIQGYDIKCICFVNEPSQTSKWTFDSGADEKCLRVFEGTKSFVSRFAAAEGLNNAQEMSKAVSVAGAKVPALGLSNQAADSGLMDENAKENSHR